MYTVEKFKDDLLGAMKDNIVSMALFGSAAVDDATKRYSDVNTLLVVQDAGLATLNVMAPFVHRWSRQGNPPPLVFSLTALRNSQDVFAIEFFDILSTHRMLHGEDPFSGIVPGRDALRHQLEYELRSKLLALQKNYFAAAGNAKSLRDLMAKSLSSFTVLAKTILHLAATPVPAKKADVWAAMGDLLHIDTGVVNTIFDIREDKKDALQRDPYVLFGEYLALLNRVAEYVDRFGSKK